jgi:hypothetical protein
LYDINAEAGAYSDILRGAKIFEDEGAINNNSVKHWQSSINNNGVTRKNGNSSTRWKKW